MSLPAAPREPRTGQIRDATGQLGREPVLGCHCGEQAKPGYAGLSLRLSQDRRDRRLSQGDDFVKNGIKAQMHVRAVSGQLGLLVGQISERRLDGLTLFGREYDHGMLLIVPGYRECPRAAERISKQV